MNPSTPVQDLAAQWKSACRLYPIYYELAREFVSLVEALLRTRAVNPVVVHVNPTRTGGILIEWEDGVMQHEVEINPDHSLAFLHLNKTTGHIDTRKLSPGSSSVVHPGLLQQLCQLLAA